MFSESQNLAGFKTKKNRPKSVFTKMLRMTGLVPATSVVSLSFFVKCTDLSVNSSVLQKLLLFLGKMYREYAIFAKE